MIKVDCKKYADEILEKVSSVKDKGDLLIVTTGLDPASESYVKGKMKDAEKCGIETLKVTVKDQAELDSIVNWGNYQPTIRGIIVQLPLTKDFDEVRSVNQVCINKDVDGFRPDSPFSPCTPEGIMYLLKKELGDLTGKTALVIGRGKLVGEPIAKMLLDANCTVTMAHSKTKDLESYLYWHGYDIIISAVGKPAFIDLRRCECEIIVDVGIGMKDGKLYGDCYNFDSCSNMCMKVVTIPNGIGLMTRAMLMAHVARLELM